MELRVGIVGPKDSVDFISGITAEYGGIQPIPFIYKDVEETTAIVRDNQELVDMWFFSGLNPYTLASQTVSNNQLFFYPELDSSSLMKVLVEIGYKDKRDLLRISVDMLKRKDVYEAYQDLGISHNDVYVFEYPGYTNIDNYINFHLTLLHEGKTDVCVTCLHSVYEDLQRLGVPVYRITPTRTNIKHMLKTSIQKWETLYFKQSQIAVILIQIGNMDHLNDSRALLYRLHRINLKLQEAVVDFAESITGSFVPLGIGRFLVFSTRGSLEREGSKGISLLEKLSLITDIPSNIGIGYGETSLAAEENARLALHHAQQYDECCAFLVDGDGTVQGPLGAEEKITFEYRTKNKEINDMLKRAGIAVSTYNKILSIQKSLGNHAITAADVADWLKMTHRNARRILNSLAEQRLAEVIGEEAPPRGRPRKMYRVGLPGRQS